MKCKTIKSFFMQNSLQHTKSFLFYVAVCTPTTEYASIYCGFKVKNWNFVSFLVSI